MIKTKASHSIVLFGANHCNDNCHICRGQLGQNDVCRRAIRSDGESSAL